MPTTARGAAGDKRPRRKAPLKATSSRVKTEAAEALFDPGEALSSYDETYLLCRDIRHSWRVVGYYQAAGVIHRQLACDRCPMIRNDALHRDGTRDHPKYVPPPDYKLGGRVTARDVVQEMLNRVDVYGSEDDLMRSLLNGNGKRRKAS